jgi:hypothetical protein
MRGKFLTLPPNCAERELNKQLLLFLGLKIGSVVQWIVCRFPEPKIQVRSLSGLPKQKAALLADQANAAFSF